MLEIITRLGYIALVIYAILQVLGAIRNIEGPIFWVGRRVRIRWWKCKKRWPIQMKPVIDKPPTVFHGGPGISIDPCPRVTELYVNCPIEVSIKNRNRYEVIESAEIELTNDNQLSWKGHEARSYELELGVSPQMVGKRLDEILDRTYEVVFSIPIDDYLKGWYNSYCATSMYAKIRLTVRNSTCEVDLGIIKRPGRMA